jgi:hypothetical protein
MAHLGQMIIDFSEMCDTFKTGQIINVRIRDGVMHQAIVNNDKNDNGCIILELIEPVPHYARFICILKNQYQLSKENMLVSYSSHIAPGIVGLDLNIGTIFLNYNK